VEIHPSCREAPTSSDVSGTTKRQVAQDGMSVNLRGKDFKDWRKRGELFAKANDSFPSSALNQFYNN
jgi:hypothetical protein